MAKVSTLKIALIHGWAGYPEQWNGLATKLQEVGDVHFLGTNYLQYDQNEKSNLNEDFDVVIAHSFGFRYMIENEILASRSTILLSPLLCFEPKSVGYKYTKRMIKAIPERKVDVLNEFFKNGNWNGNDNKNVIRSMDADILKRDLSIMITEAHFQTDSDHDVIIFEASDDRIVPNPWSSVKAETKRVLVESDSHFLFQYEEVQDAIFSEFIKYKEAHV